MGSAIAWAIVKHCIGRREITTFASFLPITNVFIVAKNDRESKKAEFANLFGESDSSDDDMARRRVSRSSSSDSGRGCVFVLR